MDTPKNRSIIKKIIIFPLLAMLIVSAIMIVSTIVSYHTLEKAAIESEVNSMQISINQLENQLDQLDNEFLQFISASPSYSYLSYMDKNTLPSQYILYQAEVIERLENQILFYEDVGGVFSYFSNIDLITFRGNDLKKWNMHSYFIEQLNNSDTEYNHWHIVEVDGRKQLIVIKKYLTYYWGCWIPVDQLVEEYGLVNESLLGTVYISDSNNINTLDDEELNKFIQLNGNDVKKVRVQNKSYGNFNVSIYNGDIVFGTLIPDFAILYNSTFFNKILFITIILPFILTPVVGYWLQREIVHPLKKIDIAMKAIRQGELDYQIDIPEKIYLNEFDRLAIKFNEMMNDINELEFSLYRTKINQQRTQLKYISQQIRPHFVLNILNLIYTYTEDEFHISKRMILYLTEYFRYIVNLKYDVVNVSAELQHADNYLKIQKERYPERFDYSIDIEKNMESILIPPLLIQTFLENCMKYAMKNNEKLFIQISARKRGDYLKIVIEDDGNGFQEDVLQDIKKFLADREYQDQLGIGIQNAIERLDMIFKMNYGINISNGLKGGALIEITLPLEMYSEN